MFPGRSPRHRRFLAGHLGIDANQQLPDGIEAQTRQALAGLDRTHVVRTSIWIRDYDDMPTVNKIYANYFPINTPPAPPSRPPSFPWTRSSKSTPSPWRRRNQKREASTRHAPHRAGGEVRQTGKCGIPRWAELQPHRGRKDAMPRQNRVTPYGELIAAPDRGTFWGNRGRLHDREGNLVRYSSGRAWAICVLEFKGRRRPLWAPGKLTELFFLDEATALAAGHRPCGECRNPDHRAFKKAWAAAHFGKHITAPAIDAHLHADRLSNPGIRSTYPAQLADLPEGAIVELDGRPWLVANGQLLAWSPGGYRDRQDRPPTTPVIVLTPRATIATLAAGYRPILHPTAER
jgi:endoribonuclease L-PSP